MPDHLQRLQDLFTRALDFSTVEERSAYLNKVCGDNSALRSEVESLLSVRERAEGFLQPLVPQLNPTQIYDPSDETPEAIGPYKIREQIGEGGFGLVYAAEQTAPVRRMVALKVIKLGMDTKEVLGRFEAEKQALAMMDHAHIAKVFDAGTTETGRPYFVMELIRGMPITQFCRKKKLDLRGQLKLFVDVCRAVQHAHQKGIIHRDLKPSNILITLHDGEPVVKVIDFGVAKALSQKLTEQTVYTRQAQMIGTPAYMSPEQAELSGLDIDTRSDVYSLGVLLYELLTGATPFDQETLLSKGFDEMRRTIREDDPPRPSQRISTLDAELQSTLQIERGVDNRQWSRTLQRELDWIVMKALEKNRERRYESASDLAADVERYLNDEPVEACPPSLGYRLSKAIKRQKGLIATIALVLLTAIIGMIVSLVYAGKATSAAGQAKLNETAAQENALEAKQNALAADENAEEAKRANAWSQTLLYAADMKLASDAIRDQDTPRAIELLNRHVPAKGQRDLRGFEWHFFHKSITVSSRVELDQGGWVCDVCCSPDGKWLATTAQLGTVRIHNTNTWQVERSFSTLSKQVNGLDWSHDGQLLAAACSDGSFRIWDMNSGEQRLTVPAHEGEANDVVFGRDDRILYSCGDDHLARAWDVETGKPMLDFTGHQREVERIALSPDGKILATASSDATFALCDTATGERLHWRNLPQYGRIVCVAFSPDGEFVAVSNINGHILLTAGDGQPVKLVSLKRTFDGVEALTFFGNGKWLATADRGGGLFLQPVPASISEPTTFLTARPLRWTAHQGRALSITTAPDGKGLISGGRDGFVRVWEPDLDAARWELDPDPDYFDITAGSKNRFYVAGRTLTVWDAKTRRLIESFAPADPPWQKIACSLDGQLLAAVRPGQLALFECDTRKLVQEWPLDKDPHTVAVSSDGRFVAFAEYTDREVITVYKTGSMQPPKQFPAKQCECLAFSPDGRWLAAGDMDDLQLLDFRTGKRSQLLKGHSTTMAGVAFSPDSQLLATVSHGRLLKIRRVESGEELFSIVAHRDWLRTVAFSPDGRTIATAGDDQMVKLWHTATGQPLGNLMHERGGEFGKLCFSSDGLSLIGFRMNSGVVIYDASSSESPPNNQSLSETNETAQQVEFIGLGDLPGPPYHSHALGVSSNGQFVAGYALLDSGHVHPIRWARKDVPQRFAHSEFGDERLSGKGTTVSDQGMLFGNSGWKAHRWTTTGRGQMLLPQDSEVEDITPDGQIAVGKCWMGMKYGAFRWEAGQTKHLPLSPKHQRAEAHAGTVDGKAVFGVVYNCVGGMGRPSIIESAEVIDAIPVVWKKEGLRFLPGFDPKQNWWVSDVSNDGSVVVGFCWPPGKDVNQPLDKDSARAFRWELGQVRILGCESYFQHCLAYGVSGDGRLIVGQCIRQGKDDSAFIWDAEHGARFLTEVLTHAGAKTGGWNLGAAEAISRDGSTIVGHGLNPAGNIEAWAARLPPELFESPAGTLGIEERQIRKAKN